MQLHDLVNENIRLDRCVWAWIDGVKPGTSGSSKPEQVNKRRHKRKRCGVHDNTTNITYILTTCSSSYEWQNNA